MQLSRFVRHIVFALALSGVVLASHLAVEAMPPQQVGTWASIGPMAESRTGAASVALPDGRTVIVGGLLADGSPTNSIVTLNPVDNVVTPVGLLSSTRVGHTATLLKDGRVLVTGGTSNGTILSDIEVIDVAAGTTTPVAFLHHPRTGHAAARLEDGQVLIVGGTTAGDVLASAERVNVTTAAVTFTPTSMATARTGASATTLIDGRVLVVGGNDGTNDLATAEIFYPYEQAFGPTDTSLSVARSGHTALLLPHNHSVLIAGGTADGAAVTTTDWFLPAVFPDPYLWSMGTFAAAGPMAEARTQAMTGALDEGYAFVSGGGSSKAEKFRFATIKTDKDDYAPYAPAVISGSGWAANERVTLVFQEDPGVHADYALTVTADAEGNFTHTSWTPEEHDLGVRFYLMATGEQSGAVAQTTFTDGPPPDLVITSPTTQNKANVAPGGIVAVTITHGTLTNSKSGSKFWGTASYVSGGSPAVENSTLLSTVASTVIIPLQISAVQGCGNLNLQVDIVEETLETVKGTTTTVFTSRTSKSEGNSITVTGCDTTPPVITVPGNLTAEATSPAGAIVTFSSSATDGVDGAVTATCTPASGSTFPIGTTTVTCTATDAAGNTGSSSFTVTVTKPAPTASITNGPVNYTGAAQTAAVACLGGGAATLVSGTGTGTDAGSYPATVNCAESATHRAATGLAAGNFVIGKATVTVTASSPTVTYGGAVPTITPSYATFLGSDTAAVLDTPPTCSTTYTETSNAGTTPATSCSGGADNNYSFSFVAGTVTITKAAVTATAGGYTGVFDGATHPTSGCTVTGFAGLTCTNAPATVGAGVGSGPVTPDVSGINANFDVTSVAGSWSITAAPSTTTVTCSGTPTYTGAAQTPCSVTVTSVGVSLTPEAVYLNNIDAGTNTASASYSYAGDANHQPSSDSKTFSIAKAKVTATAGGYTGVFDGATHPTSGCTVTGFAGLTCTNAPATVGAGVGSGPVTPDVSGINANFDVTSVAGSWSITAAPSTTTVTCSGTPTYTGAAQTPCSVTVTSVGVSLTPEAVYLNNIDAGTNTASASYSYAGDANHQPSSDSKTFSIAKAKVTATAGGGSSVFGSPVTLAACAVTGAYQGNLTCANNPATVGPNAGTTPTAAVVSGDHQSNFDITLVPGSYTISRKPATVVSAPDVTGTYNGSAHPAAATCGDGLTASISYSGGSAPVSAGDTTFTATCGDGPGGNYDDATDDGTITIAKAKVTATAGGGSSVFGSPVTLAACAVTGAYQGNLTCANNPATVGPNAGTTPTAAVVSGDHQDSFDITLVPGSYTISRKPATVASAEDVTGIYNGSAFPAAATCGDGLTASISYSGGSAPVSAGDTTFTATCGDGPGGNYDDATDDGTITIAKAKVTATAGGGSSVFGSPVTLAACAVTGAYQGNLTCANNPATVGPNAGTTPTAAVVSGDHQDSFDITLVPGSYTISRKPATVASAEDVTGIYNGSAFPAAATCGDGLTAVITYSGGSAPVAAGATTFSVTCGDGGVNYDAATDDGTITIAKAKVTATAGGGSSTYNGAAATPAACVVSGDFVGGLSCVNNPASVGPNAGTTPTAAVVSGSNQDSFDISYAAGSYTIAKKTLTASFAAEDKVYDGTTLATVDGCSVNGVEVGDTVTCSVSDGAFDTRNVRTDKTVTANVSLSGASVGNYSVAPTATATAAITKLDVSGSFVAANKIYDGNDSASVTSRSVGGTIAGDTVSLTGGSAAFDNRNVGDGKTVTASGMSLTGTDAGNYNLTGVATTTANITAKALTITAATNTKTYDGNVSAAATPSPAGLVGGDTVSGATEAYDSPAVGTGKTLSVTAYTVNDGNGGLNYSVTTVNNTTGVINPIATSLALTVAPGTVQYSDNAVFTAIVTAASNAGGAITGSVMFSINGTLYGPVPVNAAGYATLVAPITNNPGFYSVVATFTSTNSNYASGANDTKPLTVTTENANPISDAGAYTGQQFAWTPTATSNTATITLAAIIKDASDGTPGNITKAKISFAIREASGGLTPISSAQDLPVGLVDPTVNTTGSASAIVQFSLNSNELCVNHTIAVKVSGSYNMPNPTWQDTQIAVCRATTGSILSAPAIKFSNARSGGFLGNPTLGGNLATATSNLNFDVKYNKSGTNPQGKVFLTVFTNKNAQGVVDGLNHTYYIASNAIATLSVRNGAADFSAKANVTEIVTDEFGNVVSTTALDGGAIMNLSIVDGTTDQIAITVNKSKSLGGVWYSSNWNGTTTLLKGIVLGGVVIAQ